MNHQPNLIRDETAFRQIKYHGSWKLPRNSRPCDIDFAIDNRGHVLFGELKYGRARLSWGDLADGQLMLYKSLCSYRSAAVLCRHFVPKHQDIDTRHDIDAFVVMVKTTVGELPTRQREAHEWEPFMQSWFRDPVWVLETFRSEALHLRRKK